VSRAGPSVERFATGVIPVTWSQMAPVGVNGDGKRETGLSAPGTNHLVEFIYRLA